MGMDCVPRTCMGTVAKLYCALREVDQQSAGIDDRLGFIRGEVELVNHFPDSVDFPPEDGQVCCEHAVPHLTDRILLSPQLMSNHALKNYEQAFENLAAQRGASDACVVS